MCRFIAYRGEPIIASKLLHEPKNSLIHQSYHAQERQEPLNGDGFGFGWYVKEISSEPALFRSMQPAWNNPNLKSIADKTKTDCLFAHIRAATHGEVNQQNCHPFRFKHLMMMHNGYVPKFEKIKRSVRELLDEESYLWVRGQTDTEHLYALFLTKLRKESLLDLSANPSDVLDVLISTIHDLEGVSKKYGVEEPSLLNLVITNGSWMIATKYISPGADSNLANTLYYSIGVKYECHDGVCMMKKPGVEGSSALIVSEKLTKIEKDWIQVPLNHAVIINEDSEVITSAIS